MTTIYEKEILVIENLKAEVAKMPLEVAKIKNDLALNNKRYFIDIVKVSFYGITVGTLLLPKLLAYRIKDCCFMRWQLTLVLILFFDND